MSCPPLCTVQSHSPLRITAVEATIGQKCLTLINWPLLEIRVSSKRKEKFGSNPNKPKQHLFRVCFGLFRETKKPFFGLFRCFEPIQKQPKQTKLFRNEPK